MKRILTLVVAFLIGWIIYVQFFGTAEDKALKAELLGNVKETGQSVLDILSAEKNRIEEGAYYEALDKLAEAIDKLRNEDKRSGGRYAEELANLEQQRNALKKRIAKVEKKAPEQPASNNNRLVFKKLDDNAKLYRKEKIDAGNEVENLTRSIIKLAEKMEKE